MDRNKYICQNLNCTAMKVVYSFFIIGVFFLLNSNSNAQSGSVTKKVLISTNYGDIKIELFNETPLHRDNFIKLAKESYFDGTLFHRVINNFMIQGGDPNSKGAEAGKRLGNGGPGYEIPAEFNPRFYHKKGALAAARQGDQVNPEKKSSGSQFYIVEGKIFTPGQLDTLEINMNNGLRQSITRKYLMEAQDELNKLKQKNDEAGFNKRMAEIRAKGDADYLTVKKIKFSANMIKDYTTIGGYPSLDGAYTVFGQVIEGLDVVDKIAKVQTDKNDRPVKDVVMKVKVIE
jgi:cyclophilin family peptidyl-prolyl cis-trans isomerase